MEDPDYILMAEIIYRLSHEIKLLERALVKSRHAQEDLATAHKRKTDRAICDEFKASSRYEVLDVRPQIGVSTETNAVLLTISTPYDTSLLQKTAEARIRNEAPVQLAKYFGASLAPNFIITPDARRKIFVVTIRVPYTHFAKSFEQEDTIPDLYCLDSWPDQHEVWDPLFSLDLEIDKHQFRRMLAKHSKQMENMKEPEWSERTDFVQGRLEEILEDGK